VVVEERGEEDAHEEGGLGLVGGKEARRGRREGGREGERK